MLDGRFHRAALVVLMLPALVLAAFSLRDAQGPRTAALAPDAFDETAALRDLRALSAIPGRSPGSPGDLASAALVASRFRSAGLEVTVERVEVNTPQGERPSPIVIARRNGFSQKSVVIAADRLTAPGIGQAGLTGTAVLIELARDLGGRTLARTVELVSTGAGPGGGLAGWRPESSAYSALVLGDLSGSSLRSPYVVPWAESASLSAPSALERSIAGAVETETGLRQSSESTLGRFARLALPLTSGQQGGLVADGLPSVMISSTGEQRSAGDPHAVPGLAAFGRSALRAAGLLDAAPDSWPGPNSYALPLRGREIPQWVLRLLAAAAILAAVATGVDALARARRSRAPVARGFVWFLSAWPAFLLAWLWLVLAGVSGMISGAPASTAPPGSIPVGWPVLAAVPLVAAIGWLGIRPVLLRRSGVGREPGSGAPAALMLASAAVAAIIWIWSPLTAILIVPFIHVAPWLCDPERSPGRRLSLVLLGLTLLPLAACVAVVGAAFGAGPFDLVRMLALLFAGSSVGLVGDACATLIASLFSGALILALRARRAPPALIVTRGPISYAGPGSLGGTGSAIPSGQGAIRD